MPIRNLATHPTHYVTVAELADYWAVSRQQIYKRIELGSLNAIRLGSRLYRIRTDSALDFERRALVSSAEAEAGGGYAAAARVRRPESQGIGLQRVRGVVFNE